VTVQETVRLNEDEGSSERRARILDAAERCFVRAGFHRTTMQDIAAEARMSPGNLYRYFPSKDSMVAGLGERDRAAMAEDFSKLPEAEDFVATLTEIARKHFEEEPRERAILCLEIWAEATRNPTFAALTRDFDCDVIGRLTTLFRGVKKRGLVAETVDPEALAQLLATLADGLFVRKAVMPGFDAPREVANLMAVMKAALAGHIPLTVKPGAPAESHVQSH
jgi:TetR/AcrR family transcriptional regulator, repressor for uid operon